MTIRIDATRTALTETYVQLGAFFGLATDDPGSDAQPINEPPSDDTNTYQRAPSNLALSDPGDAVGQCIIHADPGTYTFAILCTAASGDNMIDNCPIASITLTGAGHIVLDATYKTS